MYNETVKSENDLAYAKGAKLRAHTYKERVMVDTQTAGEERESLGGCTQQGGHWQS